MVRRKIKNNDRKLWDEDFTKIWLKKSKNRAVILCTIIFFCFSVISMRLIVLMVFDHETLSNKAEQQYRRIKTLRPQRGIIWDRTMRQMAISVDALSLYAVPSRIDNVKDLSSRLAPIIKIPAKKILRKILSRKDKDFIWLARKMDNEAVLRINELKREFEYKELGFITEPKRYYPKGKIASHILGYTNIDDEGLDGVELKYNDFIKGKGKKVRLGRDARGYSLYKNIEGNVQGNSLMLTIDEGIQYIVERELENAVNIWKAEAAVAIMMNPKTGEILAMANRPTYDPNFAGRVKADVRRNRAITDIYEPGSTFKAILASAAIEEEVVALDEKFDVSKGFIKVPGGIIHDAHKHEVLFFGEVIQKSSNVGAVQIALKLGDERFYNYMKKFGFGMKTGIDLLGETRGILRRPRDWSGRSLASLSIGQEIGVTPLQLLRAYAAIANGGTLMKPYVVSAVISPTGEVIKSFSPKIERRVMSENNARIISDILKTVVKEGGTAQQAAIKGNLVAGKTGTAQMIDPETGRYSKKDFVSSFVGFVPADNPEIALIVVVFKPRGGKYGGVVAAPVFKNIIENTLVYLNIPMEMDDNHVFLVSSSN